MINQILEVHQQIRRLANKHIQPLQEGWWILPLAALGSVLWLTGIKLITWFFF